MRSFAYDELDGLGLETGRSGERERLLLDMASRRVGAGPRSTGSMFARRVCRTAFFAVTATHRSLRSTRSSVATELPMMSGSSGIPWWASHLARLAVLLTFLGVAVAGLVGTNTSVFSAGGGASRHIYAGCVPSVSYPLVSVDFSRLAELRAGLLLVMARVGGRRYANGIVTVDSMWSDNPPQRVLLARSSHGLWPAGYEMRQWASDGDDIVADVLLFARVSQARDFFGRAASTRCRPGGAQMLASSPPNARDLVWRNPDGVVQEDVYLLRGQRVYRVSDVRPQHPAVTPSSRQQQIAFSTVNGLACALPGAGCKRR